MFIPPFDTIFFNFNHKDMLDILFSHKSDEWSTPQDLFDNLDSKYHFTLDVCATPDNAKCSNFFTIEQNGLLKDWSGNVVWCNPPYSHIKLWILKAIHSSTPVVMLVPARVDTKWFHDLVYHSYPYEFIKGRLKFGNSKNPAPFPSMLIYFNFD